MLDGLEQFNGRLESLPAYFERLKTVLRPRVLPPGGAPLQVLRKRTAVNFDVEWADAAEGGGAVAWDAVTDKPATFPPSTHNHNDLYSLLGHNHAGVYAIVGHDHAGVYALVDHNHSGVYALIDHNHSGVYATVSHDHAGVYSAVGHDHAGVYATVGHGHAQLHDRVHAITSADDHTATAHRIFYSNGSGVVTELAFGTSGQYLKSNGTTSAPSWETPAGGTADWNQWELFRSLDADVSGTNGTGAQQWFPTNGQVAVTADQYQFEGFLYLTTGAKSHTVGVSFGGTATVAMGVYNAHGQRAAAQGINATQNSGFIRSAGSFATNRVIGASGTTAGGWYWVQGIVRFSASGTFIPQFTFSAAPGTPITVHAGTWFGMTKIKTGSGDVTRGTWT